MIEGLNKEQSMAAKAINGPVIVFAGAGSGKTRTLTYRIINMVVNEHINPYNILAITYTNKATNEMRERLKQYIDINTKAITISTFHSLCAMILRREIDNLGYTKDFSIADEEDQAKIVSDILKEVGIPKNQCKKFQNTINFSKCFMTKPVEYQEREVYDKYEERMKSLNCVDFEDLLLKVLELFINFPNVLSYYQYKYQYILVDEFQDTNLVQYKIVRLLALNHHNLFVVGDDDQSIYSFRGTNYENVDLFKTDFPEHQLFTLTENYRSSQTILNAANRLISHNKNRERKEMYSSIPGEIDDLICYKAKNESDEAYYVADNLSSLKSSQDSFNDFAILYRSSVLLRNIEIALINRNIPYKVYGGVSYLRRREIKDIIAYFKIMINPNDFMSFKRVINTPTRGIGTVTVNALDDIRKIYKKNVFETIDLSQTIIKGGKYQELSKFKDLITKYAIRLQTDDLLDIFDDLVEEIGYYDYLKDEYEKREYEERCNNLKEFKSILYNIQNTEPEKDRFKKIKVAFDEAILADDQVKNQNENREGIIVSTIHSVKGLEFKYVFIIGMEQDVFPNFRRVSSESEMEEERRIAYVAVTRAKKKLYMTYAERRMLYGTIFNNQPSEFLLQALGTESVDDFIDAEINNKYNIKEVPKVYSTRDKSLDNGYNIGDVVNHTLFGEGIILGIDKGIGNIFFKSQNVTKKILLTHPTLSKK